MTAGACRSCSGHSQCQADFHTAGWRSPRWRTYGRHGRSQNLLFLALARPHSSTTVCCGVCKKLVWIWRLQLDLSQREWSIDRVSPYKQFWHRIELIGRLWSLLGSDHVSWIRPGKFSCLTIESSWAGICTLVKPESSRPSRHSRVYFATYLPRKDKISSYQPHS